MPSKRGPLVIASCVLWGWTASTAAAPLGTAFTYQGQLKQAGTPLTATADFQFSLWDAATNGAQVGSTLTHSAVSVDNGLFTAALDFGPSVFTGSARWLEIAVRAPAGGGGYTILAPRQELTAAPHALYALTAPTANNSDMVDNLHASATPLANALLALNGSAKLPLSVLYTGAGNGLDADMLDGQHGSYFQNAGNLNAGQLADTRLSTNVALLPGIQTFSGTKTFSAAPSFTAAGVPFSVSGASRVTNLNADLLDGLDSTAFLQSIPVPLSLSGTSATHIIQGENASTSSGASGVKGLATGATGLTYGGYFASDSTGGRGVYAEATAASGSAYGVYGQSDSTSGRGVFGQTTAATGTNYGVYGRSDSTGGRGVYGLANAASGTTYGGYFANNSPDGTAVYGSADANTGTNYGGYFVSDSTDGAGVFGNATAASGSNYGVYGQSDSSLGRGVFGEANGGAGAYGVHGRSAYGRGVYGNATASAGITYGGLFESHSTSGRGVHGEATAATGNTYGGWFESASTSGRAVTGLATATSGVTFGVSGQSDSNSGRGVAGFALAASGYTYGGYFESDSTSGRAVHGEATATTGTNYGGWFQNASPSGYAVFGLNTAASGLALGVVGQSESIYGSGVAGFATSSTGTTYGVYGRSESMDGRGVYGVVSSTGGTNYGGWFESASTIGRGVCSWASATSGSTYGLLSQNDSTSGCGVYGYASANTGSAYGGRFVSDSTSGRGVWGFATAGSGTIYGVYGSASTAAGGCAVYASGDMGASGTKSFRIDHPDDPANKYLLHYSAESPEVINFYRGNVLLDGAGEAVVALPHYFAKINKSPSYQLTALGAPMPSLHVAAEIDEAALTAGTKAGPGQAAPVCSFRIAGGVAGGKVCWRVEALRNDLRVRLHPARVEVDKAGPERGTYQHPAYYGQPPEKGMDRDALPSDAAAREAASVIAPR